ncbi:cytochrome P450 [Solwaraspora sp. WMMD792]|uniref:cytochrome P450 n=1 Tax=Solwaraspora sp. WMMD792 TaxID=3016099 RepID=UPI00241626EB|nr:cytochrome P450 [Solwaraspora sp. WMMD792]MDG4768727.1 cytochrome P450 [Solwaraspora sp. WMMD792]MDG4771225.1 cytochrome P450 [Solwaraspora sp. WMMD792]
MAPLKQGDRPPGPRGHWLTGNTPAYEADRIGFIERNHREYGDVFTFDDRTVFVIDPELAHDVLTRPGNAFLPELAPFDARPDLDRAAERAEAWMPARRAAWAGLDRQASAAFDGRTVEILDADLDAAAGRETDVLAMMRQYAAATIADYCFGADSAGVPELLAEGVAATAPFETAKYGFAAWLPIRRNRRFFRAHRTFTDALLSVVRRRRAGTAPTGTASAGTSTLDLLDVLLAARPALPDRAVVSTLRPVLLGGHGVPAAALTSLTWELASRPELVAALRAEAGGPAGSGDPPPAARLPLAEAVVNEALRLYPPAWLMTRTARTATGLGPWTLRPGDEVLIGAYLIHRDPRWWQRPDEFDPGRWAAGRPAPGAAFLPFGAGPRVCIGTALTMRQLTLTVSRLAQRGSVESSNAASTRLRFAGRLAPAGLRARFVDGKF